MRLIVFISTLFITAGCSSVMLQPVDFSWPVETVLKVNQNGQVSEDRYAFDINVKPIFYEEFDDSNSVAGREIRVIRDRAGHYYFTGSGFKNIYLFMPVEGGMKLADKINISDSLTLKTPVFNQKSTNVELIDGPNKYLVIGKEIVRTK
ncbi:MAG: hypothetical protein HYZ10_13495 [Ignavibacteriales bacterium]|nr:hypothetical protein [Ignavibacteriales bacterium]